MTTRFRDGAVTVTLDDGLARFVRNLLSAAESATVARLEVEAKAVADAAEREWYGLNGVTRETGLSGDIGVVTTINRSRGTVTVSVGSTDTSKVGKQGKPRVVFIHRPGRNALVKKQVTHAEYWETVESLRANYHPLPANPKSGRPADVGTGPYVWVKNPAASDGAFLLTKLVRAPMKARIKVIAAELGKDIVKRAEAGRGR